MRTTLAAMLAIAAAGCSGEDAYGTRVDGNGDEQSVQQDVNSGAGADTGDEPGKQASGSRPDGSQWFSKARDTGPWAGYGPPESEAAFSARCEDGKLIFSTTEMPPSGPGNTVMHMSAPGIERDVPAIASERGLPNTDAPVDASEPWLAKLQSASGELVVRVGDSDPMRVPISTPLTSLIRDCRR